MHAHGLPLSPGASHSPLSIHLALGSPHLDTLASCHIWVGTSGYNYPEWKGSFYPAVLPATKMLPYYAARFPTVEINYTFYRMPTEKLVQGWAAGTPDRLQAHAEGAASASRTTGGCATAAIWCGRSVTAAGSSGRSLASCCFSCRRTSRRTCRSSTRFSRSCRQRCARGVRVPQRLVAGRRGVRAAAGADLALCIADSDEDEPRRSPTADYGYFRLRDEGYRRRPRSMGAK